ncbi:MAG: AAA family ATPase [Desulfopila sp.]
MWLPMSREGVGEESWEQLPAWRQRLQQGEYFVAAGPLSVLVRMRRDIAAQTPMLLLTGEDGCGKTVLGSMLAAEVDSGCLPVYFPKSVKSFEQLVERVAQSVGVEVGDSGGEGFAETIDAIAAAVACNSERLLLICDGAERIYLATLERLRKMMDRLNRVVVSMQVVLIGRPQLLDSLRKLNVCGFAEIEERHYVLQPLTFTETRSYLEFCKTRMADDEFDIIKVETVDRIYRESGGNFRKIHEAAERLCNRYNKDASFWVLLENVENEGMRTASGRLRRLFAQLKRLMSGGMSRQRQLIYGGIVVLLAGGLLLVFKADESESVAGASSRVSSATAMPEVPSPVVEKTPPQALDTGHEGGGGQAFVPEPEAAVGNIDEAVARQQEVEPAAGAEKTEQVEPAAVPAVGAENEGENEAPPADSLARRQLQQAESLLEEAQQALEVAGRNRGHELTALAESAEPATSAASTGTPDVPEEEKPATIAVLPAKVVEKSPSAALSDASPVTMFVADHPKRIVAGAERDDNSSIGAGSAAVPETGKSVDPVTVPLITAPRTKEKKAAELDNPTFMEDEPVVTGHGEAPVRVEGEAGDGEPDLQIEHLAPSVTKMQKTMAESKKIPVFGKVMVKKDGPVGHSGLYAARVAAGLPWLNGSKDRKYTMQLMALSSDTAKTNAKEILGQQQYAREATSLYIFEKRGEIPTVFMFMGEYDTVAEAEAARQQIPAALQRDDPYILSIAEAVQKLR